MDRAQKAAAVDSLAGIFGSAGVVVVTHYSGMSVAELTHLRASMREAEASFKVIKNRLAKRALAGTDYEALGDMLTGPAALAFSADPVAAPRVVSKYAKDNEKLIILGGMMGTTVLDEKGVKALADLPSLDELRGKILGMINTPATRIAGILQQPGGQLARVLNAYSQSDAA
ncbi:MAG: 50S ribosomal protein L10 [Pseudomonadota bacterium]